MYLALFGLLGLTKRLLGLEMTCTALAQGLQVSHAFVKSRDRPSRQGFPLILRCTASVDTTPGQAITAHSTSASQFGIDPVISTLFSTPLELSHRFTLFLCFAIVSMFVPFRSGLNTGKRHRFPNSMQLFNASRSKASRVGT